jgi:hypothetical protein
MVMMCAASVISLRIDALLLLCIFLLFHFLFHKLIIICLQFHRVASQMMFFINSDLISCHSESLNFNQFYSLSNILYILPNLLNPCFLT